MDALTTMLPRERLPSNPQKLTRTQRSCDRPTGQPEVHETPTIRFHAASGIAEIVALAPAPCAASLTGKRTVGSAPARGTTGSRVGSGLDVGDAARLVPAVGDGDVDVLDVGGLVGVAEGVGAADVEEVEPVAAAGDSRAADVPAHPATREVARTRRAAACGRGTRIAHPLCPMGAVRASRGGCGGARMPPHWCRDGRWGRRTKGGFMNGFLQASWKLLLIRGVIGVVFGIMAMAWPITTILALVVLWGVFVLVDGLSMLADAFGAQGGRRWMLVAMGVLAVLAGLVALTRPGMSAVTITWVIGIWMIVRGAFELIGAFGPSGSTSRVLIVLSALLSLAVGILFVANPGRGSIDLAIVLGAFALAWGVAQIVAGVVLRREVDQATGSLPAATS